MLKVIGIGDNVVDKYIHQRKMYPGGNALNFTVFASKLSVESSYMGIFGNDDAATHIKKVLSELGIDYSHSITLNGENGFARVSIEDGERVFLPGNSGGVSRDYPLTFDDKELDYIKGFDLIHTSCYSYMEDKLERVSSAGVPISFDFSDRLKEEYLKDVCANINFGFLSCGDLDVEGIKEKLQIAVDAGCDFAVASRGDKGSIYYNGIDFIEQEAYLVKPVDTMGAGDSFITGFLIDLLKKDSLFTKKKETIKQALIVGSKMAAETCKVNGTFGFGKDY